MSRYFDPERGTGRTTRMLEAARDAAAAGASVVVVGHNAVGAKFLAHSFSRLVGGRYSAGVSVSFTSGGSVQFASAQSFDLRGRRGGQVFVDHAVWDLLSLKDRVRLHESLNDMRAEVHG